MSTHLRHRFIILLLAITAVVATHACSNGSNGDDGAGAPSSVIEEVREEFPHTRTEDIAYSYEDIKGQDPDATDDQIIEWLKEAIRIDENVEAWNECLDKNPSGDGCARTPTGGLSDDNPLGW